MNLEIKKIVPSALAPTYATDGAAGADLYACITDDNGEIYIRGGETILVGSGISMAIPKGYVGLVFPRSGWAVKKSLSLANAVGVIDSDYRGEVKLALYNRSGYGKTVKDGDRIGQIVIVPFMKTKFDIVDELPETTRGDGGFGSTGQ